MGLLPFFYDGYSFRRDVINIVIEKLELLLRWFKSQNRYLFFCSSLLIIYEGNDNSAPTIRHEMERYDLKSATAFFGVLTPRLGPPQRRRSLLAEGSAASVGRGGENRSARWLADGRPRSPGLSPRPQQMAVGGPSAGGPPCSGGSSFRGPRGVQELRRCPDPHDRFRAYAAL